MKKTWVVKKLSELCDVNTGKWDANHSSDNGKYRFYTCAYAHGYCDTKRFSGECLILPGNGANVGEVFYYNGDFDAYQRTYVLSNIKISARFVYYHMMNFWRERNLNKQYGSATNFLKIGNFNEYSVAYPPLPEQKRIALILDESFAAVNKAKENTEKNLKNARELFESYLEDVFVNKSAGWSTNNLDALTTKIGSGATPKGGEESYKAEGISLIRSLNVHDYGFRYPKLAFLDDKQAEELSNVEVKPRDVLLNITGASVARCCIVPEQVLPARVNQHVSIIRPISELLDPDFLHFLLISKPYKNRLLQIGSEGGSTRQAITKAQIQTFKIEYPKDLKIQKSIVAKLNSTLIETQSLKSIYQRKLLALEELKKSILQKAFNGELSETSVQPSIQLETHA